MIEAVRIAFDPLIAWPLIWAFAGLSLVLLIVYLIRRGKAGGVRALAATTVALALANPSYVEEDREPLPSVVGLVLDRSESMSFGARAEQAEILFETLTTALENDPAIDLRLTETTGGADGTRLISSLQGLMADVPRDRVGGAIVITDGQVHDVPSDLSQLGDLGPIHALIVGMDDQKDRRIQLIDAPKFGIVGEQAVFKLQVDDADGGQVVITYAVNGGREQLIQTTVGEPTEIRIEIERRGDNIIVFETPEGREELTLANNRTAATLSGVRDGLRVLLVTGRPNSAGRVWRDLLKSDPSVDLVHFTILRPPYKQDITPLEEMALIAFPTEELFEEKLDGFDLVIFDQYERRGVITMAYLADVARYVDEGGAMLIVAGEDFAGPASLARTPLAGILPALPTGDIRTGATVPALTDSGLRHTVTGPLTGQSWGPWLRYIDGRAETGDVLMTAPDGSPLLAVDRVGEGRVAQLMSDQIWLWARGYEGGGPFAELIRRTVHWLMKEPELDERQLQLIAQGDTVRANLRTLADQAAPLTIEGPDGAFLEPEWRLESPGFYSAEVPVDQLGLYRARSGGLETVTLNGPPNPVEYAALEATDEHLTPVGAATRGSTSQLSANANAPQIRQVRPRAATSGANWIGVRDRGAYIVRNSSSYSLIPGLVGVLILLAAMLWAWRREGR